MWSTRFLAKVCAYGTFGMVGVVILAREELQGRIRKSNCYKEAFEHLNANKGAVNYFGEPLIGGFITNINQSEDADDTVYWYRVPLRGPDGRGILYYKTVKDPTWLLSRVELELEKLPGKKFLIMEKDVTPELKPEPLERESDEELVTEEKTTHEI